MYRVESKTTISSIFNTTSNMTYGDFIWIKQKHTQFCGKIKPLILLFEKISFVIPTERAIQRLRCLDVN